MLSLFEAVRDLIVIVLFSLFGLGGEEAPENPDSTSDSHMLERLVR